MTKNYKQLTGIDKLQITTLWWKGYTITAIAEQCSFSLRSVSRVLREANINTVRKNHYTLNEDFFRKIDTPVHAYLLGLLAADGCVTEKNYIAFQSVDRELVDKLVAALNYTGKIRTIYDNRTQHKRAICYRINFSSPIMAQHLKRYGITPRKSKTFDYLPNQYTWSFLLGYFDGDGCVYQNKGRSGGVVHFVGSKAFLEKISKLVPYHSSITKHSTSDIYYIRFFSQKAFHFLYWNLYQEMPLGLRRKKTKFQLLLRSYHEGSQEEINRQADSI